MDFKIINKTPLYKALSDLGKRIFLPEGIFYWSGRAKNEAELNGTIGSAVAFEKDFIEGGSGEWLPCYLEDFKEFSRLNIKSIIPYAPIGGINEIREIWIKWILKKSKYDERNDTEKLQTLEISISKPIVCQGITNGIHLTCSLFLNPGESLISPNKRWGNYDNIIVKNIGANIKSFEFFVEGKFNLNGLKETIQEVSREQEKIIIILNFPNNPTGYCPTREEVMKIKKVLEETQKESGMPFVVLVDDAYEPYVYDEKVLDRSIFYDLIDLEGDIIPVKLDGISKELLAYGGRVGFITIGLRRCWVQSDEDFETLKAELNNKLEGFIRSTISNTNHFYQAVTQKMFNDKGMDKIIKARERVRIMLKKRFELINEELLKINNQDITIDPNGGGFFLFLNINPNKIKASIFADHLLKKYKVGIIPIQKLEDNINGIRIAYCSVDINSIPELAKRIKLALEDF